MFTTDKFPFTVAALEIFYKLKKKNNTLLTSWPLSLQSLYFRPDSSKEGWGKVTSLSNRIFSNARNVLCYAFQYGNR